MRISNSDMRMGISPLRLSAHPKRVMFGMRIGGSLNHSIPQGAVSP